MSTLHEIKLGRLLVRWYAQTPWSLGAEIRRRAWTVALWKLRLDGYWRDRAHLNSDAGCG